MNALLMTLKQLRYENKSYWRNPAAWFFTFVFPIMFLIIFNGLLGDAQFYVPSIAAFSVITACYTNVSIRVTFTRDEGVLKRIRGTPLPAASFLLARVIHSTLIAVLLVAVVTAVGAIFYDVDVPTDTMAKFIGTLAIGAASFCALGLAVTTIIPNADASPPIVNFSILPLAFISQIFIPLQDPPKWLDTFGDLFPLKHYAEAMHASFNPGLKFLRAFGLGEWQTSDLMVVALWGLAGLLIAVRFFSWEPRR